MVKRLSDGKFRPHVKRCLMVPGPSVDLGLSIIHTRRRKTLIRTRDGMKYQPNMGIFNLYFMMSWVEDSLRQRVDVMKPLNHVEGKPAVGEKYILNVPMARDPDMFGNLYDLYRSDMKAIKPNQAPMWKCSKMAGSDPYEFINVSDDGLIEGIDLPEWTGYWKVEFEITQICAGLVSLFMRALREEGYSYRFESSRLTLYFANSIGASLGLPPAAQHLDLPKLRLSGDKTRKNLLAGMITSVKNWDNQCFDGDTVGEEYDSCEAEQNNDSTCADY